jgi:hypothetical protein
VKKIFILLLAVVALLAFAVPAVAQPGHKDLNGCQAGPNEPTFTVDVGVMLGLAPPGVIVEELGACCVRGYYVNETENGFPGGCCKHPWLEPGAPPTSNPPIPGVPQTNQHPGNRTEPTDPPQVGHGCKCAAAQALSLI